MNVYVTGGQGRLVDVSVGLVGLETGVVYARVLA
jgi:hypothetical protein